MIYVWEVCCSWLAVKSWLASFSSDEQARAWMRFLGHCVL